jgi:beta-phosphoglucomutase-like phosphatase (HAD superfamily)
MAACKFTGDDAEQAVFVGDAMSGCFAGCTASMGLIGLVDPNDCAATISTLKAVSADFADYCDNGIASP